MLPQIALGSFLLLVSVAIAGGGYWVMEAGLSRFRPWLARAPHRPRLILALCAGGLWSLAQVTAGVWAWALTFAALGTFPTFEESLYFAISAYTTLGLGDVVLAQGWRLLSGMAAANGLLSIGLLTALVVEALGRVRAAQAEATRADAIRAEAIRAEATQTDTRGIGAPR